MTLPPITDKDLIAWAMQSGAKIDHSGQGSAYPEIVLRSWHEPGNPDLHLNNLRKFAEMVAAAAVAAEREENAKLCEAFADENPSDPELVFAGQTMSEAIRARSAV